jgi:thermostable 8-oxoguanine DNA glycosylase
LDLAVEMGNNAMAQLLKVKSVEKKVDTPNNKSSDLNVILSEQKISSSSLSEGEMREKLKKMISGHETKAIRTFLNENIHAIDLIEESQRLRYIGPANWRVIDIVDKIKQDKLPEEKIIDHIAVAQLPYKKFTQEEISLLLRYGLSYKIINAMINVSE